eukprot:1111654-Lingulodinium_polyedra.AAC.1
MPRAVSLPAAARSAGTTRVAAPNQTFARGRGGHPEARCPQRPHSRWAGPGSRHLQLHARTLPRKRRRAAAARCQHRRVA